MPKKSKPVYIIIGIHCASFHKEGKLMHACGRPYGHKGKHHCGLSDSLAAAYGRSERCMKEW